MVKGDAPLSGEHKFFHKVKYNLAIHNQLNELVTRGSDEVFEFNLFRHYNSSCHFSLCG